jgi:hypothetical protein
MSEVKRFAIFRSAREAVKHRLKLTWVAWFYVCATRTVGGCVLMVLFGFSTIVGSHALFGYLSLRQYSSYDDLPCQTGLFTNFSRPRKGMSFVVIVDAEGGGHKFDDGAFRSLEVEHLNLLKGKEMKFCFNYEVNILSLLIYKRARIVSYSLGDRRITWTSRKNFDQALMSYEGEAKFFFLWIALPASVWLLKRHGGEAWRERIAYSNSVIVM